MTDEVLDLKNDKLANWSANKPHEGVTSPPNNIEVILQALRKMKKKSERTRLAESILEGRRGWWQTSLAKRRTLEPAAAHINIMHEIMSETQTIGEERINADTILLQLDSDLMPAARALNLFTEDITDDYMFDRNTPLPQETYTRTFSTAFKGKKSIAYDQGSISFRRPDLLPGVDITLVRQDKQRDGSVREVAGYLFGTTPDRMQFLELKFSTEAMLACIKT